MSSTAAIGGPEKRQDDASALRTLARLSEIAAELGVAALQAEAGAAARRLSEQRFFLAGLGQFKRGKSSLLNALIGRSVLPVGVPPVTSAITVVRHGAAARAEVRLVSGGSRGIGLGELASFVDERENPANVKGVVAVEVYLPVPLLETGLCLVDTPGLGSVFAGNTAVTRSFVPQIDAALLVLGSDPPITGEEAALLVQVASEVRHVIVVLNKADRSSETELREARRFTQAVIEERLGRPVDALLEVSARERLETGFATREWVALELELGALARQSRTEILESAGQRAIRRVRDALLAEIVEREAALRRPLQATEARVAKLREAASGTERLLADLGALFAATEADLARRYEARRAAFAEQAIPGALDELDRFIASRPTNRSLRDRALRETSAIAERRVREFLTDAERQGEQLYLQATERFVTLTNARLAELVGEEAAVVPRLETQDGFQKRRGFFFTHMMSHTHVGFWATLGDALRLRLLPRVKRHAAEYLREIVFANTMRIVGDLRDRVLESRRALERQVVQRLVEAVAAGERALAAASERQAAGRAAVTVEIDRLEGLRVALRAAHEPQESPVRERATPAMRQFEG